MSHFRRRRKEEARKGSIILSPATKKKKKESQEELLEISLKIRLKLISSTFSESLKWTLRFPQQERIILE